MAEQLKLSVLLGAVDRASGTLRAIGNSSKGTVAALRQAKGALRAFEAQGRQLKSLALQKQQLAQLDAKLAATTGKTGRLVRQQEALRAKVTAAGNALRAAGVDAQSHAKGMALAEARVAKLTKRLERQAAFARFRSGFGNMVAGIRRGATAIAINAGIAAAPLVGMVRTAAEFERYGAVMESLTGSSKRGKDALKWVTEFATTAPLTLGGAMDAFVKLKAFGLDPMNGTMKALVDQNAQLNGDQQQLEGIVLAVGQAWAKQKLQGEEILQLVERGVPVWDLLAKVTGKSGEALAKMASKGQLGRDAIAGLVAEMGKASAGASERQMKTWSGMLLNLGDHWTNFKRLVAESGAFAALKERLQGILERINQMATNGELAAIAEKVGRFFISLLTGAENVLALLAKLAPAVILAKNAFVTLGEALGTAAGFIAVNFPRDIAALKNILAALPGQFLEIGKAIVDGLWRGWQAAWAGLKAKVSALADSLPEWVKSTLGVKSPSRVFAGIGLNIVRGLEQGIGRNAGAPVKQINAIAQRMRQAGAGLALGGASALAAASPIAQRMRQAGAGLALGGASALAAASPIAAPAATAAANGIGGGIGGDTIHITVNAAPGADGKALAAEVERVLARHASEKAARLRSALHDID